MQKDDSFRQSKFSDIVRCMDLEFVQHLTVYPYPSLVQEDFFSFSKTSQLLNVYSTIAKYSVSFFCQKGLIILLCWCFHEEKYKT